MAHSCNLEPANTSSESTRALDLCDSRPGVNDRRSAYIDDGFRPADWRAACLVWFAVDHPSTFLVGEYGEYKGSEPHSAFSPKNMPPRFEKVHRV